MQSFHKGLSPMLRRNIDSTYGGTKWNKNLEELLKLFEEVAVTEQIWSNERVMSSRKNGLLELYIVSLFHV